MRIAHTAWTNRNVSPFCVQVKGLKLQPCTQQASTLSLNPFLATFIFSCFILCTSHIPFWGWNPQAKATSPSPAFSLWYLLFTLLFPLEYITLQGQDSILFPVPGAGEKSSCSHILSEWMLFNKYSWLINDACLSFWSIPSLCNGHSGTSERTLWALRWGRPAFECYATTDGDGTGARKLNFLILSLYCSVSLW